MKCEVTSIQSMAVFSSSTTIASILRPSTTDTAVSYFRWIGLHKSTIRPRTPETERRRITIIAKRKGKSRRTWKYSLKTSQSLLKLRFSIRFMLICTCLKELVINILKFLVCFYVQFPEQIRLATYSLAWPTQQKQHTQFWLSQPVDCLAPVEYSSNQFVGMQFFVPAIKNGVILNIGYQL